MQDVETPACKTIAELASFPRRSHVAHGQGGLPGGATSRVKAIALYLPSCAGTRRSTRQKLKAVLNAESLGPATEAEIRQAGR